MNKYYSQSRWKYKKRYLGSILKTVIKEIPIVVLTGSRQVGKSTLLQNELPAGRWKYLTLDDFDVLERAKEDPVGLISGYDKLIIDEVQKERGLIESIKLNVDKGKGKYILSGSANILLMDKISETLAGRAAYLVLDPMIRGEIAEEPKPKWFMNLFEGRLPDKKSCSAVDPLQFMLKGFMPRVIYLKKLENILKWWEGYVATYMERDLRNISNISSLTEFRKVMEALALRTGNLINQSEIARDSGVSQSSAYRYINLMEVGHIIKKVTPFFPNRTKRIVKSPKVYWVDPALAVFLSGYYNAGSLKNARELGGFFENLVFLHLNVLCELMVPKGKIYYYREVNQKEVDFVIEYGKEKIAVEVKLTVSPHYKDTKGLRYFMEEYPDTKSAVLIHAGREVKKFGDKIVAVPWSIL
jgi:uncharacterized protein